MNPKFIIIDGKTYRSIDEMPPDVRQKYEQAMSALPDTNGNQIPDAFENMNLFGDKNKKGVEFNNIEELPPEARQKYEKLLRMLAEASEKDGNSKIGIMKIRENSVLGSAPITSTKIVIDGKEFNSIEDLLSPETRAQFEEILGKLDANQNGIPDFVETLINATNQTANVSTSFGAETPPSPTFSHSPSAPTSLDGAMSASPTIEPEPSNGWLLALAGLFGLLLCVVAAAGIWYFFLR